MQLPITFRTSIAGIPCGIYVDPYDRSITVLDRKGYTAPWLERKVDIPTERRLHAEVDAHYKR